MPLSKDVRAAIGDIVVETTLIEYAMAVLIARVERVSGEDSNILDLLGEERGSKLVERAKRAAPKLDNAEKIQRTKAWLEKTEGLREERHEIVHSIVAKGTPGWTAFHPKERTFVEYKTRDLVDLVERLRSCAEEGKGMADSDWRRPL